MSIEEFTALLKSAGVWWPRGGGIVPPSLARDADADPEKLEEEFEALYEVLGDLDYTLAHAALKSLRRDPNFRYVPEVSDVRRRAEEIAAQAQRAPTPAHHLSAEGAWQQVLAAIKAHERADLYGGGPRIEWREHPDGSLERVRVHRADNWREHCLDAIAAWIDQRGGITAIADAAHSGYVRREFEQWWRQHQGERSTIASLQPATLGAGSEAPALAAVRDTSELPDHT